MYQVHFGYLPAKLLTKNQRSEPQPALAFSFIELLRFSSLRPGLFKINMPVCRTTPFKPSHV